MINTYNLYADLCYANQIPSDDNLFLTDLIILSMRDYFKLDSGY